ncbi:hypothetical protein OIU78_029210 [Salix suchowensis]|nr:hypothetical protein OIU78_029210 [Salix suchowensis]
MHRPFTWYTNTNRALQLPLSAPANTGNQKELRANYDAKISSNVNNDYNSDALSLAPSARRSDISLAAGQTREYEIVTSSSGEKVFPTQIPVKDTSSLIDLVKMQMIPSMVLYKEQDNKLDSLEGYGSTSGSYSNADQVATVTAASESKNEEVVFTHKSNSHRSIQREAALTKFRLKRKERCYGKKVRYESRKKLAEQRPRVKGQFVRQVHIDPSPAKTDQ